MRNSPVFFPLATLGLLAVLPSCTLTAADAPLPAGARLAIVGDSITEQKLYTKYMEAYLLACAGRQDVKVFQYGWGGETAGGFAGRLANDLTGFQPTVATLCYGMNDGQYRPYASDIGRAYETNMRRAIEGLVRIGVKIVVIGSPGAVDTKYFANNTRFAPMSPAEGYNQSLGRLRDIDRALAAELGQVFADVHQPMIDAMAKAKAALGEEYDVCGRDGFHPGPNGHLVMAYAFLRALGCDGNIGEIVIDMNGQSSASGGHKVVGGGNGQAEIESSRYPFCFDSDSRASRSTRSITPFFPFNQEMNRFTLKVKNLNGGSARVTWGGDRKEFTREQLQAGINLAAEFPATPFDNAFRKVLDAVAAKQNYETMLIKSMITNFRQFSSEAKNDPELAAAFATVSKKLTERQTELDASVRKAVLPVRHTLSVTAVP